MDDFHLEIVTEPTSEPLDLTDVKQHLYIDGNDDDTWLNTAITLARKHAENITNRALITQTWNYYLDEFEKEIRLPKPPFQSLTSITYTDTDGNSQTLASTYYTVSNSTNPGYIYRAYSTTYPATQHVREAVVIKFVCGYGTASSVPEGIKHAMLLMIGHWYENREESIGINLSDIPMGVGGLLSFYKVHTF